MKDPLGLTKKQRKLLIEKMRGNENPYIMSLIKQDIIENRKKPTLPVKKCKYCKTKENLTIDHKVPKSRGGKNIKSNYQDLCARCNGIKSDLTDKEVRRIYRWFLIIRKERTERGANPEHLF